MDMDRHALPAIAVLVLLAGCSAGGQQHGTLFGTVNVQLFDDPDPTAAYGTVQATFFDGPSPDVNPSLGPLAVSQTQGDCRLLVPKIVSCTPACGATGVCTDNDRCASKPASKDAGTLHVMGLGGIDIALEPTAPTFAYSGPTLMPFPPCAEGGDVTVNASAFTLMGKCIAPLTLTGPVPIPARSGQAATITWTPPGRAGISRVQLALEISHHGGYKGEIDCDVADTGSFAIPAPLVTALINLGRAGYPIVQVTRASTAMAAGEPGVKLVMQSFSEREVDTGVISCMDTATCPSGTICQGDRTCQ
jgi:hypothetical protein